MGVVSSIEFFWSNMANPAIAHIKFNGTPGYHHGEVEPIEDTGACPRTRELLQCCA
jgi:hypothetical protein